MMRYRPVIYGKMSAMANSDERSADGAGGLTAAVHELAAAVYTAYRGYAWSSVPESVGGVRMDALYRMAAEIRGEFPSAESVDSGVVSDGVLAAAFSIFTAPRWDSEGRAAEYAAFAFIPCDDAASVDFEALLRDPFFCEPAREPPRAVAYAGAPSAKPALDAPGRLLSAHRIDGFGLSAAGEILAKYGARSGRWVFRRRGGNAAVTVECGPWRLGALPGKG